MTTIFELLDRLETEIVSLRSQNLELRTSLYVGKANGIAPSRVERKPSSNKKVVKRSAAKAKKKKKPVSQKSGKQLELPVQANGDGDAKRSLGKRQALGKSLLQFRKKSSPHEVG